MIRIRTMAATIAIVLAVARTEAAWSADTDEITLFNGAGKPEAYIALNEEMTIYLWSGRPVAYLKMSNNGYDVYGFNGDHLGWFVNGVVWSHDGEGGCATKNTLGRTDFEPFKPFKQFKPFKSFPKFVPFRPYLSGKFGNIPCQFLLAEGAK